MEQANDLEGLALTQRAFGLIFEAFGDKAEAVRRLQWAKGWFETFGDGKTASALQERLNSLQ